MDSPVKVHGSTAEERKKRQQLPGTLPACASDLSKAARGLLMRLLERDPRVRMRNLRQLQQSAFYMGFKWEHVKAKKVSPKDMLNRHFPDGPPQKAKTCLDMNQTFAAFDQELCK